MRILHAKIFGFGKWVDYSLTFPKEGPIFIYGENESGKSTFHQFILFMLFGMQPKQRKFYQPKTSSKLGGQLVLSDSEIGEFTIERLDDKNNGAATCYTSAGDAYDEAWLKERLRGMNQQTFEAIFSFSAIDLNDIKKMDEEDLGEVLLSIGLTGSNNIYRIEKNLDARLGELFKPFGKNPEINKQLQTLNELAEQLTWDQNEEAGYREKTAEAQRLTEKLNDLQFEKQHLEDEDLFITKQRTALPVIQTYQRLISKQKKHLESVVFPEQGVERLEKLKDELRPLESEYAVLKSNEESYQGTLESFESQELGEDLLQATEQKQEEAKVYFTVGNKIDELQAREAELEREISEELEHLHIDLNQADLAELSLPFYIEETWKQLKTDKDVLGNEKATLEGEERGLREEEKYLKSQLKQIESELLPEKQVNEMNRKLNQGKEYEQLERLYQSSVQKEINYKEEKEKKLKKATIFLGASVILFILTLATAYFTDQSFFYGLSLLFIIVGIGQWLFVKQNVKQLEEILAAPIDLKGEERLSEAEITQIESQIQEEEQKRNEISQLQTELRNQTIKLVKWEEKQRMFFERNNRLSQQIEENYTLYPYLEQINISYWPEYFHRLKALLKWNETYRRFSAEINERKIEQKQTQARTFSFIKEHFSNQVGNDMSQMSERITEVLNQQQQLKQRITHVEELLSEIQDRMKAMTKRMSVYKEEIGQLLSVAGLESEEEYYKLASYVTEKEKVEEELELNHQQLDAIFPNGSWSTFASEQLDALKLQRSQEENEEELKQHHTKIETTRSELAEINAELKRLEGSEAYSQKMHQFEMEKEKLNQLTREWSILKIEKEVLAETKQNYREKYLTKVMEETANFLHTVTAGSYENVYSPANKQPFLVLSADGIRYSVNELSQGTMNQLYVSLRLAISKVMTESHELPFILDDAFVHFDEVRVKRMIEVLAEIASKQQVIMFTCKSDVLAACEQLEIPVIKL